MGLGLFLLPALGGYWFLTHLNYTRYGVIRESGYHVLFRSAFAGVVLFGIAWVVLLCLNQHIPQIDALWKSYVSTPHSDTVAVSILLGVVLPVAGNLIYSSEKGARKVANDSGDLIEVLMEESIEDQTLVEISLRTRKSYIGFALQSRVTSHREPDLCVIPIASGYRDKDTQELNITTNYAPVIQQSLEESLAITDEDFRIIIPMSEVVSVRLFLPEAYVLFQGGELPEDGVPVISEIVPA